eukprot:scaffold187690_cov30-Prasinocladus_malaysianus.AAC.1
MAIWMYAAQVARPNARYILIANNDAAWAMTGGAAMEDPNILALLMHTSFADKSEQNKMEAGISNGSQQFSAAVQTRDFSPESLEKIRTLVPQVFRWRYPLDCGGGQGRFAAFGVDGFNSPSDHSFATPLNKRPIDIAFVGQVRGTGRDELGITAHRRLAVAAIRRIGKRHGLNVITVARVVPYKVYFQIVRTSKLFVSPFGIGEFSGKDYEALLAGSLLVKPLASRL